MFKNHSGWPTVPEAQPGALHARIPDPAVLIVTYVAGDLGASRPGVRAGVRALGSPFTVTGSFLACAPPPERPHWLLPEPAPPLSGTLPSH